MGKLPSKLRKNENNTDTSLYQMYFTKIILPSRLGMFLRGEVRPRPQRVS